MTNIATAFSAIRPDSGAAEIAAGILAQIESVARHAHDRHARLSAAANFLREVDQRVAEELERLAGLGVGWGHLYDACNTRA